MIAADVARPPTLGGVWQAVLAGFAGVRVHGGVWHIDPCLPAAWPHLEVRFRCLERRVRLMIDVETVVLHSDGPIWAQMTGHPLQRTGGTIRFTRMAT